MVNNPDIVEQCQKMDAGDAQWIADVEADINKARIALAEKNFAEALRLAERAKAASLDMQEDRIDSGYELEHEARMIIAKVQSQTV